MTKILKEWGFIYSFNKDEANQDPTPDMPSLCGILKGNPPYTGIPRSSRFLWTTTCSIDSPVKVKRTLYQSEFDYLKPLMGQGNFAVKYPC